MAEKEGAVGVTYRLLGSSGLRVFPLGLGTMHFGQSETFAKWNIGQPDPALNEAIFLRYLQAGGNFIDTANFYQGGDSERQIGSIIAKHGIDRERLVIATKYSLPMVAGDPNRAGNHKKNLLSSVKDSLRRLGTDYIDLLYVHFWDFSTPVEDLMRALNEVVESGMVLHVAASDIPAWVVAEANTIARARGWNPFVAYQGKYSLVERSLEQEVFPMAHHFNIATIPWGALGQGKLTGKVTRDKNEGKRGVTLSEADFIVQDEVLAIAKELNRTPTQVALNWALQRTTSPLLGPRTLEQLEENLAALQFTLSPEHVKRLDNVSKDCPPVIFPHYWNGNNPADCPWLYAPEKKYSVDVSPLTQPTFPTHT